MRAFCTVSLSNLKLVLPCKKTKNKKQKNKKKTKKNKTNKKKKTDNQNLDVEHLQTIRFSSLITAALLDIVRYIVNKKNKLTARNIFNRKYIVKIGRLLPVAIRLTPNSTSVTSYEVGHINN